MKAIVQLNPATARIFEKYVLHSPEDVFKSLSEKVIAKLDKDGEVSLDVNVPLSAQFYANFWLTKLERRQGKLMVEYSFIGTSD